MRRALRISFWVVVVGLLAFYVFAMIGLGVVMEHGL